MRARRRRTQVGWVALAVLVTGTMVGSLVTPAEARVRTPLHCGLYRTWTDGYSGDVVRYRACVQMSITGNYVAGGGQSYFDVYRKATPVGLYHVHVTLLSPTGSIVASGNCETGSLPIGSGHALLCTSGLRSSGGAGSGWTTRTSVCLFFDGKTDCSPSVAYTY